MEHAKKMVLIPSETVERFQRNNIRQGAEVTEDGESSGRVSSDPISRLDSDMRSVLNQPSMDDAEKWKLYQQMLHRYLYFAEESRKPLRLELHSHPETNTTESSGSVKSISGEKVSKVLATIPKTYRSKAELLLRHLASNDQRFSWDNNGVVAIDGVTIQGSNIVDLVNDGVRHRKGFHAVGRQKFARFLHSINTPQEYIGNPEIRRGITAWSTPAKISPVTPTTSAGGRSRYDTVHEEDINNGLSSVESARTNTSGGRGQESLEEFSTPKKTHSKNRRKGASAAKKSSWFKLNLGE